MKNNIDIIIMGGGMAGLTLSLQLIMQNENISILILEKQKTDAREAAHKVGESIVELSAHYLRKDLGLKAYLEEHHLPKFGFRYFLDAADKTNITERIEAGSRTKKQAPSHHIDRGRFENDLIRMLKDKGVKIWQGAQVLDATIALYSSRDKALIEQLNSRFSISRVISFEQFTGSYLTSSSFAVHIAQDKLVNDNNLNKILVVNNLLKDNLGLILIAKDS